MLHTILFTVFCFPVSSLRNIILPVVLYGCETWYFTPKKEHRLRMSENRVLRRIFRPKREEGAGDWRRLHKEELRNLYDSLNFLRAIKSRRRTWEGDVTRMGGGEMRNAYTNLVG
jgi:hypothetical protein